MDYQEWTEYFYVGSVKAEKASGVGREEEVRKASLTCFINWDKKRMRSTDPTHLKDMKEVFWPLIMKTSAWRNFIKYLNNLDIQFPLVIT